MNNKKAVILLTGTIKPDNMVFTELQNSEVRQNQYIDSIKYWLKIVNFPIVFVENSNVDISDFFKDYIRDGRLHIYCFNGNNFNKSLGKGYGELECLEYVYKYSKIIRNADFIFKITGRYKVININDFIKSYIDEPLIDILVDFKWNLSFCDSRFFGFKPSFIQDHLLNYKDVIDDSSGIYFEHILCKASLTAISNNYVYRPFITLPRIEGYSASTGVKYNSNYVHWFRYKFNYIIKHWSFGLGNLPWI